MKPVEPTRLKRALDRARAYVRQRRDEPAGRRPNLALARRILGVRPDRPGPHRVARRRSGFGRARLHAAPRRPPQLADPSFDDRARGRPRSRDVRPPASIGDRAARLHHRALPATRRAAGLPGSPMAANSRSAGSTPIGYGVSPAASSERAALARPAVSQNGKLPAANSRARSFLNLAAIRTVLRGWRCEPKRRHAGVGAGEAIIFHRPAVGAAHAAFGAHLADRARNPRTQSVLAAGDRQVEIANRNVRWPRSVPTTVGTISKPRSPTAASITRSFMFNSMFDPKHGPPESGGCRSASPDPASKSPQQSAAARPMRGGGRQSLWVCDEGRSWTAQSTNGGKAQAAVWRAPFRAIGGDRAVDRRGHRDVERDIAEGAENVRHHFDRDQQGSGAIGTPSAIAIGAIELM